MMSNRSKQNNNPSQSQPPKSKESSPRKRKAAVKISQTLHSDPKDGSSPGPVSVQAECAAGKHQEGVKNSSSDQTGDAHVENLSSSDAVEDSTMLGSSKELKKSSLKENGTNYIHPSEGLVVAKKPRVSISPDESVKELKKTASEFKVKRAAYWGEGEKVPFMFVVKVLDAISKESGRKAITEIVCNMLRTVIETTPDDLLPVVYLLANRIAPAHEGLELGIGDASIIKALAEACGAKEAHIKKQYKVIY